MIKSPIKFDDLAFILLFFFMIIAVISFSSSMEVKTSESAEGEKSSIPVYLDENGNLSRSEFSDGDAVDLSISPSVSWDVVQNAVQSISSQNATVTLVIQ